MVSHDDRRANGRDALVTSPLSDPRQGVCSLRGQPPQATPRCGSQLHGGPRVLRSMRHSRASTMGRSHSRIMDIPGGKGLAEDPARRYWSLGRPGPSHPTSTRNLRLGGYWTQLRPSHSRLGTWRAGAEETSPSASGSRPPVRVTGWWRLYGMSLPTKPPVTRPGFTG